jgi:uncharacterized membrane protein
MRFALLSLLAFLLLFSANRAEARLEICNQTDLVLMVVVGYDTTDDRTVTEGWWRIYPGMCEIPVDVALLKGSYFVHAESNPRSTMPDDAFAWGDQKPLCVKLSDFRIPNGNQCAEDDVAISFNQVDKNWRNSNKVDIIYPRRAYDDQFSAQVAGVQRMLSIIGYDIGEIDGVIGEKMALALNEVGLRSNLFGFDFARIFPALEKVIADQQKLDN